MGTDGQKFLKRLAQYPPNTFEQRFVRVSTGLGLGSIFGRNELSLLYEAAFRAALCRIAFNGAGGCQGEIKPQRERYRIGLEREFMLARDTLYASPGWQELTEERSQEIKRVFLTVLVEDRNLAW